MEIGRKVVFIGKYMVLFNFKIMAGRDRKRSISFEGESSLQFDDFKVVIG